MVLRPPQRGMNGQLSMRWAGPSDASRASELILQAKTYFRSHGIDMWQNGYPSESDIDADIAEGGAYVCMYQGTVVGYVYIHYGEEDCHRTMRGRWEDRNPAVFHRSVVDEFFKGIGIGKFMIGFAEDAARAAGCTSMRTETGEQNVVMRGLMHRLGYREAGIMTFDDSDKVAFEKML